MADNENKMSKEDVVDVMKMAQSIYNAGNMFGVFTPQLLNQNLESLNNNAAIPNKTSIDEALKDYKHNSSLLSAYSEFAKVYDPIYNRALEYYAGLLAFDMRIEARNVYRDSDYNSQEYKDDRRRVDKFFDNFDYKDEFRRVVSNVIRNEVYYTWFRDTQGTFDDTGEIQLDDEGNAKTKKLSKYTLQMMPQERCLLTGAWEGGLLYDFDMYYFLKAGVDINAYDPTFKKYYNEMFGENADPHYNPTAQLDKRTGSFALWTQTSPDTGAWVFKGDMSTYDTTPFLSSLVKQVLSNEEVNKLQSNKYFLEARALLAGEIGMLTKQQSGQTQDKTAFNSTTLTKFLSLVKMGLLKDINPVAMPVENLNFYQFENKNPDMYSNQLSITAGNGASAGTLLYSTGKTSQFEMQSQITTDYNLVKKIYPQFEHFLNFYVNKKTRKYKFNFHLSGCTHSFIREQEKKNLLDLANLGIVVNPSAYSKVLDMTPTEFERSLTEAKSTDWTNKLTSMLLSVHTQSAKDAQNQGRPQEDDGDISDSGATSRDYDNSNK